MIGMKNDSVYVYKIKHKFSKRPWLLEKLGFMRYEDEDGEPVIAKAISLPVDCSIVKSTKALFEYLHKHVTDKEREEDFSDYSFDGDSVVMTPKLEKEWTRCQLCFYLDGEERNQLFINAPDKNQYYNKLVLDECVPEEVAALVAENAVYRARGRQGDIYKDIK